MVEPAAVPGAAPGPDNGDLADLADLESLFRSHHRGLVRLAMVLTGDPVRAEDLAQEAFVRYHQAGRAAGAGAELAYLRRTVINLAHSEHRRLRIARAHAPAGAGTVVGPEAGAGAGLDAGPEARAVSDDRRRRLVEAVRRLPDRQRDCVVLHYFEDLPDTEIADVLGISAGSVKTHLHRARATLAATLEALR